MHFVSRARRLPVLFASAALLSAGLASPAMAAEDLQPLPPIQEAARGSLGSSIGDALGSSSACTKLENQLAEIKELWDAAEDSTASQAAAPTPGKRALAVRNGEW